jgi:inorganic pyrophosphatase
MQEPVEPLTIVHARAIGGLRMVDDKGGDDKIIAVCVDDPAYAHYQRLEELPSHVTRELDRFFRDYKQLEDKRVEVEEFYDKQHALAVIEKAAIAYRSGGHGKH